MRTILISNFTNPALPTYLGQKSGIRPQEFLMTMVMMVHGRKYLIKRFGPPAAGNGEVVMVTMIPYVPLDLNVFSSRRDERRVTVTDGIPWGFAILVAVHGGWIPPSGPTARPRRPAISDRTLGRTTIRPYRGRASRKQRRSIDIMSATSCCSASCREVRSSGGPDGVGPAARLNDGDGLG